MIITVTLNPSLDKTLSVPQVHPGKVHRAQLVRRDLGGKGINVSRALRKLGLASKIIGVIAGATGQALQEELLAARFDCHFIKVDGDTRQNITLFDEATGQYTKINEPGPTLSPTDIATLETQVKELVRAGDLWAFCGSLPVGVPADFYARLIEQVQSGGGYAFLDTSGPALKEGLAARPFAVKPNSEEIAELLQHPLDNDDDYHLAAHHLQAKGVKLVVLSRGEAGLVLATDMLATDREIVQAKPPSVAVRSPIGAGDATLAGMLWAVSNGYSPVETARWAVACGTAAAMKDGTGLGDRALIEQLLWQVNVAPQIQT